MNVLMFGWELPPYNSGGLGTACLGITEGLAPLGVNIDFVVPEVFGELPYSHMQVLSAADYLTYEEMFNLLPLTKEQLYRLTRYPAYASAPKVSEITDVETALLPEDLGFEDSAPSSIPDDVTPQIRSRWYALQAAKIAQKRDFDIIHCHDWMTYHCGIVARREARKQGKKVPFVAHVHATEIDRCGENGNPAIISIEKRGLRAADRVIAVSSYTKRVIHKHYGIPLEKISVAHNGIFHKQQPPRYDLSALKRKYKIALFMGRLTMQKGPEYFIHLAKAVTDRDPNIRFVMVGSGDMEAKCIEMAAHMGLTGKVLFSSFLRGKDVDKAYQLADLFIMPSVSEPFGIVALEAIQNGTPALISKQSGVAEVSEHFVQADFWDIDKMTEQVVHLMNAPHRLEELKHNAMKDLSRLSWEQAGYRLKEIYDSVLPQQLALQPVAA